MSTRTNIEFITEQGEKVLFYQHHDGYIEGIIPELHEFFKWYGNPWNDLEYATANFVFFAKRYIEDWAISWEKQKIKEKGIKGKKFNWKQEDVAHNIHLGHGICQPEQIHGDIEYFYRVLAHEDKIEVFVWEMLDWDMTYKGLVESKPTVTFTFEPKTFKIKYVQGDIKREDVKKVCKRIGFTVTNPVEMIAS